jgi:hypothetical protein
MQYNTFWILWGRRNRMEMPGQGFWFIATVLVPENAGTKAQLPKIEVTRKHRA